MLKTKRIEDHDAVLVKDTQTGKRAAFINKGTVVYWDATISRRRINEAVKRKLDWSGHGGRYAVAR